MTLCLVVWLLFLPHVLTYEWNNDDLWDNDYIRAQALARCRTSTTFYPHNDPVHSRKFRSMCEKVFSQTELWSAAEKKEEKKQEQKGERAMRTEALARCRSFLETRRIDNVDDPVHYWQYRAMCEKIFSAAELGITSPEKKEEEKDVIEALAHCRSFLEIVGNCNQRFSAAELGIASPEKKEEQKEEKKCYKGEFGPKKCYKGEFGPLAQKTAPEQKKEEKHGDPDYTAGPVHLGVFIWLVLMTVVTTCMCRCPHDRLDEKWRPLVPEPPPETSEPSPPPSHWKESLLDLAGSAEPCGVPEFACIMCRKNRADTLFEPCHHMCCCRDCARGLVDDDDDDDDDDDESTAECPECDVIIEWSTIVQR